MGDGFLDGSYTRRRLREGLAGPHAGKTCRDVYGIEVDYLRQSSLNRKVWHLNADVSYRLGRKAGSISGEWSISSSSPV